MYTFVKLTRQDFYQMLLIIFNTCHFYCDYTFQ